MCDSEPHYEIFRSISDNNYTVSGVNNRVSYLIKVKPQFIKYIKILAMGANLDMVVELIKNEQ